VDLPSLRVAGSPYKARRLRSKSGEQVPFQASTDNFDLSSENTCEKMLRLVDRCKNYPAMGPQSLKHRTIRLSPNVTSASGHGQDSACPF
jgi:hypothetical protein